MQHLREHVLRHDHVEHPLPVDAKLPGNGVSDDFHLARVPCIADPRFVIQKHRATSLHYDFRLEVDGTLKSWAVPKGPSTDPREKRLAVEVEDHSLAYADFEGKIGPGYGAGAVIVWDSGTYRNLDEQRSMSAALEAGHAKFWLEGEKLSGGWTLQRTRGGKKPQWLLIKRRDQRADARRNPQSTQPESVKSGRTIEEVAGRSKRRG
jgi:DNA ligase D-like protein (predicted 3'-phosphoesterase)